jgi:hypothetical protein
VQITTDNPSHGGRNWVLMSMDNWVDLVCFIRRMDLDGLGILQLQEVP